MSKRIERSRRHAASTSKDDGRVSVVTSRNPPRDDERSTAERTRVAFRHELSDRHGYTGTFVTEIERWDVGDIFTTGDGRTLRITAISASERSNNRPAYTDRWSVEAARPGVS